MGIHYGMYNEVRVESNIASTGSARENVVDI